MPWHIVDGNNVWKTDYTPRLSRKRKQQSQYESTEGQTLCDGCGETFLPYNKRQKVCSRTCFKRVTRWDIKYGMG